LHALIPGSHLFGNDRGKNLLDGGAPFYDVYTCEDGGWMSVGCLEPQFFKEFITHFSAGLPKDFTMLNGWKPTTDTQTDRDEWPQLKEYLENGFMTNTRDYWAGIFHGTFVPRLRPVVVIERS
jgi:alpha-methylacyl-CoA racemase